MKKFLLFIFIFLILIMPVVSYAQTSPPPTTQSWTGLVPCGTNANPKPCEFKDFIDLINNVIKFILVYMAVPIAAIMFVYAGVLLVASGAIPENRSKAKSIFTNTLIGLVLAVACWLIVKALLFILEYQ